MSEQLVRDRGGKGGGGGGEGAPGGSSTDKACEQYSSIGVVLYFQVSV